MTEANRQKKTDIPFFLVFFGTIVVILIPTVFTAVGWQTLQLQCVRHEPAKPPSCEVQNGYLFGLIRTPPRRIDQVVSVGYHTSSLSQSGSMVRTHISTVVLSGPRGAIPIFETASNVNEGEKNKVRQQVSNFLEDTTRPSLGIAICFGNIFGWLGLPFFLLVVVSCVYTLSWYMRQAVRKLRRPAAGGKDIPK